MRPGHPSSEALNEDELLFLWKGLVEEGRLSVPKLQQFMETVAGVRMTVVQAKDLLNYMDANGDGRVGMEDFKSFLSIGHLADTDVKSFMWEPRKKFQEENPHHKHAAVAAAAQEGPDAHHGQHPHAHDSRTGQHHDDHDWKKTTTEHHDHDDHRAHHSHGRRMSHGSEADHRERAEAMPPVAPHPEAKKRPALHHAKTMTGRLARQETQASLPDKRDEADLQQRKTVTGADISNKVFRRPPPLTPEVEKKIEQALLRYEEKSWEKFLGEEKTFKRHLFEQFSGLGNDDLSPTEYHKMLMKWMPLASWCAPSGLRPADSLAALEYVQRRDLEGRGLIPRKISPEPTGHHDSQASSATQVPLLQQPAAASAFAEPMLPTEAKMSFKLWLDVIDGKHQPEEHMTEVKNSHPHLPDAQVFN